MTVTIDASVWVAAGFVHEPGYAESRACLLRVLAGRDTVVLPWLAWVECVAAVARKTDNEVLAQRDLGSRVQGFWVRPAEGQIHVGYLSWNFPTLFGVNEERAQADMGPNWLDLPPDDAVLQMRRWTRIVDTYLAESAGASEAQDQLSFK